LKANIIMKKIKKTNLSNKKDKLKKVGRTLLKSLMSKQGITLITILALYTLNGSDGAPPGK